MQKREEKLSQLYLTIIGLVFGISLQYDAILFSLVKPKTTEIILRLFVAFIVTPAVFFVLRKLVRQIFVNLNLPRHAIEGYAHYDTWTYAILLIPMVGISYVTFTPLTIFSVVSLFGAAQLLLIAVLMGKQRKELLVNVLLVPLAFHISGFCALIYQVVWQRVLFTEFGANIESITVVVSVFMFGLGIGSLVGGFLAVKYPAKLPVIFMTCEILTGLFGLMSLQLIRFASSVSSHDSFMTTALVIFSLLSIPTLLMGATLPVLVTYLYRTSRNIGKSVGSLYFLNTLGAAAACFVTTDIFFSLFGKQATIVIAASCNLLVGFLVYLHFQMTSFKEEAIAAETPTTGKVASLSSARGRNGFFLILFLSCITGYISLSQEILWFRAMSYASGGKPVVFAHVLGVFLLGIALGSLCAKRFCFPGKDVSLSHIALTVTVSSAVYYCSLPFIANRMTVSEFQGMLASYILVGTVSFLMGSIFPTLCHNGIRYTESVGISVSWVYFANIIGATAGPLLTGFVFLNVFTLERNILYLTVFMLITAVMVFLLTPYSAESKTIATITAMVLLAGLLLSSFEHIYSNLLVKLQNKAAYLGSRTYNHVIQNRSGIITVTNGSPNAIYGGGIYDGMFSTDATLNANGITRAYMMAAFHPKPVKVLEIGLSSGSWAKVISNYSDLESLTIIEINPGYVDIIRRYPEIAPILQDPKVHIHIDDGRRWLLRNGNSRFDFIVMNTTFHWRDGITNLLSSEFLRLCKKHLKEGGVLYYNTTGSEDVIRTAANEFKHIARYMNFVAASDNPFAMTQSEIRNNLLRFEENGQPILAKESTVQVLNRLVDSDITDKREEYVQKKNLSVITDDNMASEFRKNNLLGILREKWSRFLQ